MFEVNYREAERKLFFPPLFVDPAEVKYKIHSDYLRFNCYNAAECDRELMVSFFPMLPLLKKNVPFEEADYILYAHPYARIEDMSPSVIKQLKEIDECRKPGAEIIVVGKACNVEPLLEGSISNITFYESHFTEKLGKRFEMNIKDDSIVYDSFDGVLNIWPVNGCLRKCKFCRRTYMNIPFESLSLEYIKNELDYLKETQPEKLKNVFLRAENLTEYGIDIYGKQCLPELMDLLDSYDEIQYLYLIIGTAICETTDEILAAFCRCNKLAMIALNPEAGSNRLLKVIGKDHTRERAIHIFKELRKAHPDLYISSTIMVGLPTETLSDIYELADLIEQAQPDSLLCNYFGLAPKYPLAKLPQLSDNLKEYHLEVLLKLLKKQKRKKPLRISHERIFRKGSKAEYRFQMEAKQNMEKYSLLIVPKKRIILK